MLYFDEPVGRVKIQTTSKILSDTTQQNVLRQIVMFLRAYFADIYLRGMRDKSVRSGTELTREIQTCLTGPLEYKYRVYSFWALFVLYEVQLDNKICYFSANRNENSRNNSKR